MKLAIVICSVPSNFAVILFDCLLLFLLPVVSDDSSFININAS